MTGVAFSVMASALWLNACASEPAPFEAGHASTDQPELQTDSLVPPNFDPSAGSGVLDDSAWTVTTLNGAAIAPENAPTLAFQGRGVTGSTGCNRYFGPVSVTAAGAIAFAPMGVSRRACAPALMDLENDFLAALADIDGYELHGDEQLRLSAQMDIQIEAQRQR